MDLITVAWEKNLAFRATVRGHELRLDMPDDPRSTDAGPSPAELLVMALGGCIGGHIALFCHQRGLSPEGIRVDLDFTLGEEEGRKRVDGVYAEVEAPHVPADLAPELERVARSAIVPNTLARRPEIEIVVRTGPAGVKTEEGR